MKIYDKAKWHIEGGENKEEVLKKLTLIFQFLNNKKWLTSEGEEILELGIDSSTSVHERMVNDAGKKFLDDNYDTLLNSSSEEMAKQLDNFS